MPAVTSGCKSVWVRARDASGVRAGGERTREGKPSQPGEGSQGIDTNRLASGDVN